MVGNSWGSGELLPNVSLPVATGPFFNGHALYFTTWYNQIWRAPYDPATDSFGTPVSLTAINNGATASLGAWVSPDDQYMIFASNNRPGGYGSYDLWSAQRLANGEWGDISNLGPTVNTADVENIPLLAEEVGTLFFSRGGSSYTLLQVQVETSVPETTSTLPALAFASFLIFFIRRKQHS
jgi:hypothetical protein